MPSRSSKLSVSSSEEESLSVASSKEEEKTIPFLRRLRDMLVENQEFISFAPGNQTNDFAVLGRIVVHDRVQVEAKVLPRYFNHSSFASLRRQLNYFSFVRLGKGRQRESTYINENVVDLDDILHLKRRCTTGNSAQANGGATLKERLFADFTSGTSRVPVAGSSVPDLDFSNSFNSSEKPLEHRPKRRRQTSKSMPTTVSPRSTSPLEIISEDDEHLSREQFVSLDLTRPELKTEEDVLAGCKNLLYLASKGWD